MSDRIPEEKGKISPFRRFIEIFMFLPPVLSLIVESFLGQIKQFFIIGTAAEAGGDPNFRGRASIAKIDPQANVAEVEKALKKTIHGINGIDGFAFLSERPRGKEKNEHTVLIKVGVNWGYFGYPTVTSWESVYAVTKMCLQEAKSREATVRIIIGDESGMENKEWLGTTRHNFEHTGILRAAVLAGLEQAASLETADPDKFKGAGELLKQAREGHKVTFDEPGDPLSAQMRQMACQAGVEVVPFDEQECVTIPIPGRTKSKHFPDGARVPRIVDEEVTDIINLSKPPGRHLIMGNTGLTGALKNHVGFIKADDRSLLHGDWHRFPARKEGQDADSYRRSLTDLGKKISADRSGRTGRKFARSLGVQGKKHERANHPFHEKMVEIYLAFKDKERFSATDMRRTVSSLGPDFGDTIDIGAVIAARDPVTLDVLAGAFLKKRYDEIGSWFDALKPGGDSFSEWVAGKTWLSRGTPFNLKSHIAANSYGIGPIDVDHIDFQGLEDSDFRISEIEALARYLQKGRRGSLFAAFGGQSRARSWGGKNAADNPA